MCGGFLKRTTGFERDPQLGKPDEFGSTMRLGPLRASPRATQGGRDGASIEDFIF
jgi:hypothetical protein